ncbi:IPTL-CTERM sorting domain-containing protein, partial [Delftia acidovorans]|uniref:IPTL-CTERM sorting domain-containing protein n=2 Tax=Delftia TaxID=80865 RepID=UPI00192B44B1
YGGGGGGGGNAGNAGDIGGAGGGGSSYGAGITFAAATSGAGMGGAGNSNGADGSVLITFAPPIASAQAIPTLGEWSLLLLSGLLALVGVARTRRQY